MFVLILLLDHYFAKKQDGKKDLFKFNKPSSFKIIFIKSNSSLNRNFYNKSWEIKP